MCTHRQQKSIAKTARECGCSKRTVLKWVKQFELKKNVRSQHRSGRRPIISASVAVDALNMLKSGSISGAKALALKQKANGKLDRVVAKTTIIRHARKAAKSCGALLKVCRGRPPKGLSSDTKAKRLNFALSHQNVDWMDVMFTDRKRFYFRNPGKAVFSTRWLLKDQNTDSEEGVYQPNNPSCYNVYAGITRFGASHLHEVAGSTGYKHKHVTKRGKEAKNITTSQYKEVLHRTFLRQGCRLFKGDKWVLQQDNDPTHKIAQQVLVDWNQKHKSSIKLLASWPPHSPDLNLIENFWSYVERRVSAVKCDSFEEFKKCVSKEVTSRSNNMMAYLSKLYGSMPRRLEKVIEKNGGKTGY